MKEWWETPDGLDKLRQGDPMARREMVVGLWPDAKGYAHHLLGGDQAVEDVLQETFAAVLAGLPRFRGGSRLKTWVFSILHNKVSDLLTDRTRTRRREESLDQMILPGALAERFDEAGMWRQPEDRSLPDPEEVARGREIRETLEEALGDLPEKQRQVFLLRDVQGFTGREVCNILDIKPTHQRVLLHRARVALRSVLIDAGHRADPRAEEAAS